MIARYGSKYHGMCQSLVLLVFLASLGCKPAAQKQKPTSEPAGQGAAGQAPSARPASPSPDRPLDLGPLALGSVTEVIAKLQRAHYDPVALGLQELRYQVSYTWAKHDVQAKAEGRWQRGKRPEVVLLEVARKGKTQTQPRPDRVSQEIWDAIKQGIESLLQGLGHGFLSERLEQWAALEGPARSVKLNDDRLQLSLGGEDGHYDVTVGSGYQVLSATHRSPEGVVRRMAYSTRVEQGRNLVSRAVFSAELPPGDVVADEVRDMVASSQGMVFSLTYAKRGRFWLPTQLEKVMPATKDQVTLALTYLEVHP